jgi:hypothetical protein
MNVTEFPRDPPPLYDSLLRYLTMTFFTDDVFFLLIEMKRSYLLVCL